jgi:hypothetical protein
MSERMDRWVSDCGLRIAIIVIIDILRPLTQHYTQTLFVLFVLFLFLLLFSLFVLSGRFRLGSSERKLRA